MFEDDINLRNLLEKMEEFPMNKEESIKILISCIEELENMSEEEFQERKKESDSRRLRDESKEEHYQRTVIDVDNKNYEHDDIEVVFKKNYELPEDIKKELISAGVDITKIKLIKELNPKIQGHYWYGDWVLTIEYKDALFYIGAIGEINITIEVGDKETIRVLDKDDQGKFGLELIKYLRNDDDLMASLFEAHDEINLDIKNNNWWECNIGIEGETYELDWVLNSFRISDAIIEVWNSLEKAY